MFSMRVSSTIVGDVGATLGGSFTDINLIGVEDSRRDGFYEVRMVQNTRLCLALFRSLHLSPVTLCCRLPFDRCPQRKK